MNSKVYLTQTDTTIGLLSQDSNRLSVIKQRPLYKHYIRVTDSLSTLKHFTRIPKKYKNMLRRSNKSTFILKNGESFRVIHNLRHKALLKRMGGWAYSTSANISGSTYDENWARAVADEVIEPLNNNAMASNIFRINNKTIKKIR